MNRHTQQGPVGLVVTWSEGVEISAKLQISDARNVTIAGAQVVKPAGYLVVGTDLRGEPVYPVSQNTYLKYPRGGCFVRVADDGIAESGEGVFLERQYTVEAMEDLPK